MSKRESIARYNLIIKKLRKQPADFKQISTYLSLESELQEYNFNISKRTFLRDLDDIRSLYNIDIVYDFSRKVYFIDFEEQPELNERILEAFDTFNALNKDSYIPKRYILSVLKSKAEFIMSQKFNDKSLFLIKCIAKYSEPFTFTLLKCSSTNTNPS